MRSTSQRENVEEFRLFIGHWAVVDTVAAGLTGVSRRQTESHHQVLVHSRETGHSAEGRGKNHGAAEQQFQVNKYQRSRKEPPILISKFRLEKEK
jgi:ribulose 1,5-bisphosphate carboxylase large subunit-like protein